MADREVVLEAPVLPHAADEDEGKQEDSSDSESSEEPEQQEETKLDIPADFSMMSDIIVPGSHRAWTTEEYVMVEQPARNEFGDCIIKTLKKETGDVADPTSSSEGGASKGRTPGSKASGSRKAAGKRTPAAAGGVTHVRFLRELVLHSLSDHKCALALDSIVPVREEDGLHGFAHACRLGKAPFPMEIFDKSKTLSKSKHLKLRSELKKQGIDISKGGETLLNLEKSRTLDDLAVLQSFVNNIDSNQAATMQALEMIPIKTEAMFFYLVTYMLLKSKRAKHIVEAKKDAMKASKKDSKKSKKKKDSKKSSKKSKKSVEAYSWVSKHIVGTPLYHEIRITLQSLIEKGEARIKHYEEVVTRITSEQPNNKPLLNEAKQKLEDARNAAIMAPALASCFWSGESGEHEAENTLKLYTKGIFNPVLRGMLVSKREMRMTPAQLQFTRISAELVEEYTNCIMDLHKNGPSSNPFPTKPRAVVNTNTFGGGKTSVASFATAFQIHQANVKLQRTRHRIVGVYILPSLDTILSFASASSQHYVTWIAQRSQITVFFKWCPWVKTGNRRMPERVYKYSEKALVKKGLNMVGQAVDLRRWHLTNPDITKARMDFTRNKQYNPPDMIFADSTSALELLQHADEFRNHSDLHWHFLPIIDEFPATADCSIPLEKNEMLKNIFEILALHTPFSMLMSASPTEQQMTSSHFYGDHYDMTFAQLTRATNSFTQLFLHDGKAVHPFTAIPPEDVAAAVATWDETTYRCFPPQAFLALRDTLQRESGSHFPLSMEDVRNPTMLIKAIERLCKTIAASDLNVRRAICNLKLDIPQVEVDPRTTLTLLSGDFFREVLNQLQGRGVTSERIAAERADFEKRVKKLIAEHIQEMKNADREGQHMTRDSIKATIDELEAQLKHEGLRKYRFTTPLGSVTIDLAWIEKYMYVLSEDIIQLVLSGLRMDMRDDALNEALHAANPMPVVAFAPIACMFGLNDSRTDNVCIYDHDKIVGPDTLKQALARAGRSGKKNFVVAGHIDAHLLGCFLKGEAKTSIEAMDIMWESKQNDNASKDGATPSASKPTADAAQETSP